MFDNLREQANSTPFYEDEDQFRDLDEYDSSPPPPRKASRPTNGHFLGMAPWQRFIIAFMLLITVCIMGVMFLLVTGRIGLM